MNYWTAFCPDHEPLVPSAELGLGKTNMGKEQRPASGLQMSTKL